MPFSRSATLLAIASMGLLACTKRSENGKELSAQGKELAPKVESLDEKSDNEAVDSNEVAALRFEVEATENKVGFMMDAPLEKIRGKVPSDAISGFVLVEPNDLSKLRGVVTVDISNLELFQQKAGDDGEFGAEVKNDTQNEHARAWLEIDADAPEQERRKNTKTQFSIAKILSTSTKSLHELSGDERIVKLRAEGKFLLHQRASEQTVDLVATFVYMDDEPKRLAIRTEKPFGVDLDIHDVRPRTAFGKLAQKTLSAMSEKVAQVADVDVEIHSRISSETAKSSH